MKKHFVILSFFLVCLTILLSAILIIVTKENQKSAESENKYTNKVIEYEYINAQPVIQQKIVSSSSLLFVGDVMLDRGSAIHAKKYGKDSLVKKLDNLLFESDVVVANLEGTVTNNPSVSLQDNSILHFTFDPSFVPFLKSNNISVVSLSNNHALDFGNDGYVETKKYLTDSDIKSFGSPLNNINLSTSIELKNQKVCFVGYHELYNSDDTKVVNEIKTIKIECNKVIVTMHGGVEYTHKPTDSQMFHAHNFIDAGADVVIGTHPHVVQPVEIYKNKAIFYSLGNFIFDQDFSFDTTHGLTVQVVFEGNKTTFNLVPIDIIRAQAGISNKGDGEKTLQVLINGNLPPEIVSQIMSDQAFSLSF